MSTVKTLALRFRGVELWIAFFAAVALLIASPARAGALSTEITQLLQAQKWEEAAVALKNLLKKEPTVREYRYALATSLYQSGRREEALGVLNEWVEKEKGRDRMSLVQRIRTLSRQFSTTETFQLVQDAMAGMNAKNFRGAREKLERAMESEGDNVEILVRIAQALTLEGDYDTAVERLRAARKLNPFEPQIVLWLGRNAFFKGQNAEALELLRSAHTQITGSPESSARTLELAALWLSETLQASGQFGLGLQVLENDVRDNPLHVQALLAYAQALIRNPAKRVESVAPNSPDPALMEARKVLQLAQSRLPIYFGRDSQGIGAKSVAVREPLLGSVDELSFIYSRSEEEIVREHKRLSDLVEKLLTVGKGAV